MEVNEETMKRYGKKWNEVVANVKTPWGPLDFATE